MKTEQLTVGNIKIEVKRKKVKNINIRVSQTTGNVTVSAPYHIALGRITDFVKSREVWIKSCVEKVRCRRCFEQDLPRDGDTVYFCGREYIICAVKDVKEFVAEDNGRLYVHVKREDETTVKRCLDVFFKASLIKRAEGIILNAERLTGLKSDTLAVRDMKTRWGSCNVKTGRICLNLQLSKYDDRILNYIVIHEILHLRYADHGKDFKAALTRFCPDWKKLRQELNNS